MNQDTLAIVSCWERAVSGKKNQFVAVDDAILKVIAKAHALRDFPLPAWNTPGLYPQYDWTFAVNQIVSNCFNFCFNIFEIPDAKYQVYDQGSPEKPYRGALAMQRKIYQYFNERIIQAQDLASHVKSAATMHIFFADLTPIPFPGLRYECGRAFVDSLTGMYGGNPMNLLESAIRRSGRFNMFRAFGEGGHDGLVDLLIRGFPRTYGEDIQKFDGESLYFNKRPQLVALLLHGRASRTRSTLPPFSDIEEVGPIADYEVPRGLRTAGVLVYSQELAFLVDNWTPLEKGSAMEVEIRMATVFACYRMLLEINQIRAEHHMLPIIHMGHLDYWLWELGKKSSGRPHLVRTDAY